VSKVHLIGLVVGSTARVTKTASVATAKLTASGAVKVASGTKQGVVVATPVVKDKAKVAAKATRRTGRAFWSGVREGMKDPQAPKALKS